MQQQVELQNNNAQDGKEKKLSADQEAELYLKSPSSFLDWLGIIGLMLFTYVYTCFLLWIFTEWGANTSAEQLSNYESCQIFCLCLFGAYVLICGTLWRVFIGRREQMKEELIQKQLKIKENL